MKAVILDFNSGLVFISDYNPEVNGDLSEFVSTLGLQESNCQYMAVDKLKIETL